MIENPSVPISFRNEISISSRDCARSNHHLIVISSDQEGLGIPAGPSCSPVCTRRARLCPLPGAQFFFPEPVFCCLPNALQSRVFPCFRPCVHRICLRVPTGTPPRSRNRLRRGVFRSACSFISPSPAALAWPAAPRARDLQSAHDAAPPPLDCAPLLPTTSGTAP